MSINLHFLWNYAFKNVVIGQLYSHLVNDTSGPLLFYIGDEVFLVASYNLSFRRQLIVSCVGYFVPTNWLPLKKIISHRDIEQFETLNNLCICIF